jgi:arylsulfatase A-like enzyme
VRTRDRTRREFLRAVGLGAAGLALPRSAFGAETVARRPNIVFIYADDHAQHAISAYGSKINQTPHIDRLAAQGMRFTQSFVANSICAPSRATILTGLHSHLHGQMTNGPGFRDDLPTFPELLRRAGYQTAMIGKWHLSVDPSGFDYWRCAEGSYYGTAFKTPAGPIQNTGYCSDIITDEALNWMATKRDRSRPFMLWLCHKAAHRTWEPPTRYLTKYDDLTIPEPPTLFDDYAGRSRAAADAQMRISRDLFPAYDLKLPITGEGLLDERAAQMRARMSPEERRAWEQAYGPKNEAFAKSNLEGAALVRWKYQRYIKDYLRCVASLDDSVGRVLEFLEKSALDKNTVVIYSSDQGFFLGEHGWYDKRWMYEESLRTPLIVRWPAVTRPGATCDKLVQNLDMAPTILEMAGVGAPGTMQGRSLISLLKGEDAGDWRDAIYYHYHQKDSGRTAHTVARHYGVRTRRHKLMYIYDYGDWELYDLEADPGEVKNVYGDSAYVAVRDRLKDRLRALRLHYRDTEGPDL